MIRATYRGFAYFGLFSIFGALLVGFRHQAGAPFSHVGIDVGLYGAWAAVHLLMTRSWIKKVLYRSAVGSPLERQVFITVTVVTWLAILWLQAPVPGFALAVPEIVRFAACVGFVACVAAFFEGVTFPMLDALLGVPGAGMSHSQGGETPLLTGGQYARVRHPMYRSALLAGACAMVIHPNCGQLLWTLMIGATFVGFIPIEERDMLAARGESYRAYLQATPWRLFRGLW